MANPNSSEYTVEDRAIDNDEFRALVPTDPTYFLKIGELRFDESVTRDIRSQLLQLVRESTPKNSKHSLGSIIYKQREYMWAIVLKGFSQKMVIWEKGNSL